MRMCNIESQLHSAILSTEKCYTILDCTSDASFSMWTWPNWEVQRNILFKWLFSLDALNSFWTFKVARPFAWMVFACRSISWLISFDIFFSTILCRWRSVKGLELLNRAEDSTWIGPFSSSYLKSFHDILQGIFCQNTLCCSPFLFIR